MRNLIKVLAVVMVIVLLSDQAVYASGFTDWWTKSLPSWGRRKIYEPIRTHVYQPMQRTMVHTLPHAATHASWWTSSSWSHKMQNSFGTAGSTLKNTVGSASWWTSSAWSKNMQRNRYEIGGGVLTFLGGVLVCAAAPLCCIAIGWGLGALGIASIFGGAYFMDKMQKPDESAGTQVISGYRESHRNILPGKLSR